MTVVINLFLFIVLVLYLDASAKNYSTVLSEGSMLGSELKDDPLNARLVIAVKNAGDDFLKYIRVRYT